MLTRKTTTELSAIARQVGLSLEIIEHCLETELVQYPVTEPDLAELRRVRRLQALEVNLAGIEIILRMRRRLLARQAEMEQIAAEMAERQRRLEHELDQLRRRLAYEF